MADPETLDEYTKLFNSRVRYEGAGLGTAMISPCPFCCAPDNIRVVVMQAEISYEKGASCTECGRSWRAVLNRTGGGIAFEIVQTGGPDPAAYLPPMRRLDPGAG